jgi:hypothetical protein
MTTHSRPFTETFPPAVADEIAQTKIPTEVLKETMELKRIGTQSARDAQEENRRLSIPNAYSRNGTLYFELPDGTITQEDPFVAADDE